MMKQLVLTVVLVVCPLVSVARSDDSDKRVGVKQIVDEHVSRWMDEQGVPGLSLAVSVDNQVLIDKGFGFADLENHVPATKATRYRTASIAKSMTAVVVMRLVETGKIDLDGDVRYYCPEYPKKRWTVTPRQLLGHLGGVRHYKSSNEALSTKHYSSLDAALDTFKNDPLRHQPGTKYLYSTFGYNLLGNVAEGASGRSFMELLDKHVFGPAKMNDTVADNQFAIIEHRTRGYIRPSRQALVGLGASDILQAEQVFNAPLHDTSMKIPGGGLLSTPGDLLRFAHALQDDRLVEPQTRESMWERQSTMDGERTDYGLGFRIATRDGRKHVWHTGGQSGTSTVLLMIPDAGINVALMCNLQRVSLLPLANAIVELVAPAPQSPAKFESAIKRLEEAVRYEVDQKQIPAFSISLVDRDQVIWAQGFGHQDADKAVPATAETVYRVGSISKLFTDIAVMQLVESGELDLDVPVQTYLPDFQPRNPHGTPITLRQLMSHRSGLVRESPVGNYFDPDEPTLQQTVASLNQTTLVYPPETKTKYSNAAVAVVGAVLESRLESTHPQRVRDSILDPLSMNRSSFVVDDNVRPALATGWMRTYDGRRFEAPNFLLGTGPAGNLYSSVLDLSQFVTCLFHDGKTEQGAILKPETLELMTTPIEGADGKPQGFGLGFHVKKLDGHKKIGHGGAVYGFSTQLEMLPERKLGVVAASSLDGTNGVVGRLADYALRLMIAASDDKPLPDYAQTGPVPTQRASRLVGTYKRVDGDEHVEVNELGGDLFLRRGAFRYTLRSDLEGAIIVDDEVGYGTRVTLENDQRLLVANVAYERVPDEPPSETPDSWRGLIGEYGWDHNTLYILEHHGKLYALIEWFYYYPLTEVGDDTFEFPNHGLYHGEGLQFRRDDDGVATEVTAAEVRFVRREVGTRDGETFKITPVKPIDQLRSGALAASPPKEPGEFRDADLVELVKTDPEIHLDIRYASTNNFTGAVFYKQPKAYMQRPAAVAVADANRRLRDKNLGLLVHDAYRPWHVTKMFWDATPSEFKDFVANPQRGSRHNRGCAVDITLYDRTTKKPIQMVAGYDEFSNRSFPLYPGGTSRQRWYRDLLRRTMESHGFTVYEYEWWHFDYKDWQRYRIGNATFEELDQAEK